MSKLKNKLIRVWCFVLSFICLGHDYIQISDGTGSWALICQRCENVDDIHLYEKGQFGDDPSPATPEILYGRSPSMGWSIPIHKVVSVFDQISSLQAI